MFHRKAGPKRSKKYCNHVARQAILSRFLLGNFLERFWSVIQTPGSCWGYNGEKLRYVDFACNLKSEVSTLGEYLYILALLVPPLQSFHNYINIRLSPLSLLSFFRLALWITANGYLWKTAKCSVYWTFEGGLFWREVSRPFLTLGDVAKKEKTQIHRGQGV